jgi:hypothetical protein
MKKVANFQADFELTTLALPVRLPLKTHRSPAHLSNSNIDRDRRVVATMKPRISLFAEHEREGQLSIIGDPLFSLTKHVDVRALAASIDAAAPRAAVCRIRQC